MSKNRLRNERHARGKKIVRVYFCFLFLSMLTILFMTLDSKISRNISSRFTFDSFTSFCRDKSFETECKRKN
jgi:hypothetical protein